MYPVVVKEEERILFHKKDVYMNHNRDNLYGNV